MDGKKALGVLLAIVGGLVVLNFIGVHFGAIFGFLFPFILIGLGVVGWKNDKKWIGGILAAIGAIMVIGKFSSLIMLLAAIGVIVYGVSLIKKRNYRGY
ncbi:hypothetical protein [Paenibacillus sp. NEAU-GSW1]|uniref:LiaF transmembrane domain-containing protein n=1 Tax=Paenibacillus sp. NEAU-GSW1 TaxID=2682486 RepID=UPI0012E19017|nr:hypothetical protein [Paenibacillus sp. NEAU-GSW1]MUT68671.1 hypothetical protein [Paenibacillus sp. NEAU-GSW1]